MSLFYVCVFCDSFLCSISLLLLSDFLSCILNSVVIVHVRGRSQTGFVTFNVILTLTPTTTPFNAQAITSPTSIKL